MPRWLKKPALEQTTSEHLTRAFRKFSRELRRAGAGKRPDPREAEFLQQQARDLRQLAADESLESDLRAAVEEVAAMADWLREPESSPAPIVDAGGA